MKKKRWSRLGALFLMANVTLAACQQQGVELSMIGVDEKQSEGVRNVAKGSFSLTTQANPNENYIRLDWTDLSNTTYKVYQRPEGSSEFNPISMTNFENQDPVKVLNIYPSQGVPPKKVHQNDLAFSPEKQSALLNDWIKDYGLGKITVDTVNIDAFGSNPDRYLKDSSGNYKYDVLAIGFWNINYESMFLNDRGVQAVADFINYGGGVLAGHHHLGVFQLDKGLNQIKDLFGVKFVIEQGTLGLYSAPLRDTELANVDVVMPDISEAVHTSRYWYGSEKVKIEKKGLLTQYPWNIETENLLLDIPYSHNGHDFVTGDVWLSFVPGVAHNSPNGTPVKELTELPDGTTGTKGAYLSTYKNTAFIQTGHNSFVNHDTALEATEDEKKILVNTLFYLNQLSDDPYLNDHSGRDLADPVISKVDQTIDGSTFKFTVTAMDQGSTYEYYVEAQPKDGSAKLTSNIATETITTGIQGYSYVVDSNPTTEPDHTVDSTSNVITEKLSSGETYLHLKAVDGAGNVSETMHIKLEKNNASTPIDLDLTAEAKPAENMIRLDWNGLDNHTYQVFQKKEDSDEFQSISTTDFESTEQIKVLNVYPNPVTFEVGSVDNVMETYQTWDGETVTLPKAASLKRWMEEPNAESPKGYGKGLIEVTAVGFDVFNANPQSVLNQNDLGEWNYDVVFVGSWDCNGSCTNKVGFFNTPTTDYLRTFIESGRGLLVGHDFASFREQLVTSNVNDASKTISSNQIRITQKGVMTNYPWDLGEVGTILDIPTTHNNGNFIRGDVDLWMKFEDFQNPSRCFVWCNAEELRSNGETNNHYLITKNNIGVIQTGHSNGEATPDEQKVLANTLFYLNQLSDINYLNDYSGQDLANPVISKVDQAMTGSSFELTLTAMDQGSTYEYYVEAQSKDGSSKLTSNTATETIATGIKGYSYVVDSNPTTEPDNEIDSTSNVVAGQLTNDVMYLHIKAVDGAGNSSETMHIKLERPDETLPKPVITTAEQRDDQIYVNWDIEIPESSVFLRENFETIRLDLTQQTSTNVSLGGWNGHKFDRYGNWRTSSDPVLSSLKIQTGVGYQNSVGVVAHQTKPAGGWKFTYQSHKPASENVSDYSHFDLSEWKQLKTGVPAIIRFKAKGDGEVQVAIGGSTSTGNSMNHESLTYAENLSADQFLNKLANGDLIQVNNPQGVTGDVNIATALDQTYSYNFLYSNATLVQQNGKWYLRPNFAAYAWKDLIRPGQTVTPDDQRRVEGISVGKPVIIAQRFKDETSSGKIVANDWTDYSLNAVISDRQEMIDLGSYFLFHLAFSTDSQLYFDDLTIAYAPKSRLYRDGTLVHEGYTVEYEDADVQDTTAPEKAEVTVTYDENSFILTWDKVKDRGTTYAYEVSAVSQTGKESEKSDPKQVEFISGIKEYRIYIDGQLVGTTTDLTYELSKDLIGNGHLQLGVVDQAGNESLTNVSIDNEKPFIIRFRVLPKK